MPNTTGSARAACPFYWSKREKIICCDGVIDGTVTHAAFRSESKKEDWERKPAGDMMPWSAARLPG